MPMIWRKFRFFVKVWRYKIFKTAKLVKLANNGVRIQVRNGEMSKSANFELRSTQTDPKSAKIGKSECSPLFWQREKYKGLKSPASYRKLAKPLMARFAYLLSCSICLKDFFRCLAAVHSTPPKIEKNVKLIFIKHFFRFLAAVHSALPQQWKNAKF